MGSKLHAAEIHEQVRISVGICPADHSGIIAAVVALVSNDKSYASCWQSAHGRSRMKGLKQVSYIFWIINLEFEIRLKVQQASGTGSIRTLFFGLCTDLEITSRMYSVTRACSFRFFSLHVTFSSPSISGTVPASATVCHWRPFPLRIISGVLPIHVPVKGVLWRDIIMRGYSLQARMKASMTEKS